MLKLIQRSLLFFTLVASTARADHQLPAGSMNRLRQDTSNLYSSVIYSSLHNGVKRAVYNFRYDVDSLMRCMQNIDEQTGETPSRDHDLLPEHCEYYLENVHRSWYQVDRYLYDTAWDYPYVYNNYRRVRDDLRNLPH